MNVIIFGNKRKILFFIVSLAFCFIIGSYFQKINCASFDPDKTNASKGTVVSATYMCLPTFAPFNVSGEKYRFALKSGTVSWVQDMASMPFSTVAYPVKRMIWDSGRLALMVFSASIPSISGI